MREDRDREYKYQFLPLKVEFLQGRVIVDNNPALGRGMNIGKVKLGKVMLDCEGLPLAYLQFTNLEPRVRAYRAKMQF